MLMEMNDTVEDSQSFLFHSPNVISMLLLLHTDEMEHKMFVHAEYRPLITITLGIECKLYI